MVEISLCSYTVDVASVGVDRGEVHLPFLVLHVHSALVCEQHSVASVAGWHYTVEHVDTTLDALKDVLRCADTHKIAWLVLRQDGVDHLNHLIHYLRWLADSQSADCIAVGSLVGNELCCLGTQVLVGAALHNGEQTLLVTIQRLSLVKPLDAPVKPALGHSQAVLCVGVITQSGRTFVESHHDVGTDNTFSVHYILRSEDVLRPVDVASELTSFLCQLANAGQREYLEAAGISQNRAFPAIEPVQSACCPKHVKPRTQIKMISVSKDYLSLYLVTKLREMYSLDSSLSAYRHEDWGADLAVVGRYQSCACVRGIVSVLKFEFHCSFPFATRPLVAGLSSSTVKLTGLSTISSVRAKSHTSCTFST